MLNINPAFLYQEQECDRKRVNGEGGTANETETGDQTGGRESADEEERGDDRGGVEFEEERGGRDGPHTAGEERDKEGGDGGSGDQGEEGREHEKATQEAQVSSGDLRISLRSAKPATLETAINLASELELIRGLENNLVQDAKVRGISEHKAKENEQVETLLGVVEGLRQEVKSLQAAVQVLTSNPVYPASTSVSASVPPRQPVNTHGNDVAKREAVQYKGGCWECGCDRHIRRNCPYLQGN
ncbi:hypothetical protein GBF38_000196 [Nibea albiflora]|nr:hypothetical protein GBF38_000196 [Nibea albiflora]